MLFEVRQSFKGRRVVVRFLVVRVQAFHPVPACFLPGLNHAGRSSSSAVSSADDHPRLCGWRRSSSKRLAGLLWCQIETFASRRPPHRPPGKERKQLGGGFELFGGKWYMRDCSSRDGRGWWKTRAGWRPERKRCVERTVPYHLEGTSEERSQTRPAAGIDKISRGSKQTSHQAEHSVALQQSRFLLTIRNSKGCGCLTHRRRVEGRGQREKHGANGYAFGRWPPR